MVDINVTLIIQVANFLILYWLLDLVLFKPLLRVMDERNGRMNSFVEGFANERAEIAELEGQYRKHLSEIHTEAAQIRRKAKEEGNEEKAKILSRAEAEAEKIYADKIKVIDTSLSELNEDLKTNVPQLSQALDDKIYG